MEIHLSPEVQTAIDALKRQENYDRWFREKVREGRAAAERGDFIEHEEVGRMLHERYPG